MLNVIKINDILKYIKKNITKQLLLHITLENNINLDKFKKYFNVKPEFSSSSYDYIKLLKLKKYNIENLPIVCNFYTSIKEYNKSNNKKTNDKKINDKKINDKKINNKKNSTIYTKYLNNWKIQLVFKNKYNLNKKVADWNNFDKMNIDITYNNSLEQFTENNLNELKEIINYFTDIKKGGEFNTNQYIIEQLNKYIKPSRPFRYLNDLFNMPSLINRTEYFDIINNINKKSFCINNNYSGVEYLIFIDSERDNVYYFNKTDIKNVISNKQLNNGICLISVVKNRDNYIIRRVIIENGQYIKDNNIKQINDRNEKFGKILNIKYVIFDNITIDNYKKIINEYKSKINGYIDFIEFSSVDNPFMENSIKRWSLKQLPIIFYCVLCPSSYVSLYPIAPKNHVLYILYLSTNSHDLKSISVNNLPFHNEIFGNSVIENNKFIKPIQFSPSTLPNAFLFYSNISDLNNEYVSLFYDYKVNNWIFIEKAHKSDTEIYGDDFKLTELNVWNSYRNPVKFNDLIIDKKNISEQMYFVSTKNKLHEAPIKLNNFGKISLINEYVNASSTIIDLASGRASDLMSYRLARAHDILFCEIDKDAIDIALQRKYEFDNPNNTPLKIFNTNLNDSYKTNLDQIKNIYFNSKVTNILCFFALHYLTDTISHIKNIGSLISNLLDKGGEFIYTSFDGDAVIKLLEENKGKWEIFEDGKKKYSIISKYKSSDIKTTNRLIKLILPFNVNTYYYDENLINDKILDSEFSKLGLKVIKEGNFMDFSEKFRDKKPYFYNQLTEADKIFIGLYKYKVYKKS